MPIVDVEFVCTDALSGISPSASVLAGAIGKALGTPAGRTWVRLRRLEAACYAENASALSSADLPVFVTVLHAHPPVGVALVAEARLLTQTVASCFACSADRVHVQYAPAGAGRQAFGGRLVE